MFLVFQVDMDKSVYSKKATNLLSRVYPQNEAEKAVFVGVKINILKFKYPFTIC